MQNSKKRIENLTKSISDKRTYLYKELPNRLKVLIISDMEADRSACAMNVNVGSLMDPKEFLGLAHFCEHMLFMGTEKYPKEDEYSEFLNANSGTYNAYTDLDVTNYYFEISNEAFEEGLDRFAQFFLKPLFVADVVEREMKAVDSENMKNLQSDVWRFLQLQRSESNSDSVFNRFSTGNLKTLNNPGIREALLDFHSKYYSSEIMSLAILSNKSLETLEKLVDTLFEKVPIVENFSMPKYDHVPAYDSRNCSYMYNIVPVKDSDTLSFYWFLPDNTHHYKSKPFNYLSSLFGHEGPNTLTSSLIKDDLISGLTSSFDNVASTYTKFYITLTLTKKGLAQYLNVISRVLHYVEIIQKQLINKRFFQENQQISKMRFDYKSKENPMNYTADLSYNFIKFNPEDILTGPHLIQEYDEESIRKFLDLMTLNNLNIYLASKSLESSCNLAEEWYGTKYSKVKIDTNLFTEETRKCSHPLDYPPENVFIPKSLELHKEDENKVKHPEKILEEEGIVVWYKRDYTFNLPKAIAICQVYLNKNIKHFNDYEAIAYLWNSIVENELKELSYMASEANVNIKFHVNNEGLYLCVSGFNYSLINALSELVKMFKTVTAEDKQEKLKVQIERHIQELTNFYFRPPYSQVMAYLENLIVEPSVTAADKLYVLSQGVKLEELVNFVAKFHQETRFEWTIQGNVLREEAIHMAKIVQEIVQVKKLDADKTIIYRTVCIEPKHNFVYAFENVNPEEANSAIYTFFQCGKLDDRNSCILLVIESLLKDKFFNELRTKQALGYIAMLFHRDYRCNEGLACLVQSSVKSPEYIWQRIREFFEDNEKQMRELSDELFCTHVNSVIVEKKQKDLTLTEEIYRNAHEIKKRSFIFDRKEKHIAILENLKKEEIIEFYLDKFINNIKRIDVEILANNHKEENSLLEMENFKLCEQLGIRRIKTKSIEDFKRRNTLYPDFFTLNN